MAISKKNTICFVAGSSGGHIIPALTLAQQLIETKSIEQVIFFSTHSSLDTNIIQDKSFISQHIPLTLTKVPKRLFGWFIFCYQLLHSFFISFYYLIRYKPKKIISTSGHVSIPVCLAGFVLRIPIELYELNATPGKATRFLARFATQITICFKQCFKYLPSHKCTYAPYPIRFKKLSLSKKEILGKIGFQQKRTIFIVGGSQGSLFINRILKKWLTQTPSKNINIIHQVGINDHVAHWRCYYQKNNISAIVFDYCNTIEQFYTVADLVICRAGAGILFETLHFKNLCITIPLESIATNHQKSNAYAMQTEYPHLYTVIEQKKVNDNPQEFFDLIQQKLHFPYILSRTEGGVEGRN